MGAKKGKMCHRNNSLWIHTVDTLITFSFSLTPVVNFLFVRSLCVCVCVHRAARLKRKPRGAWFIYKAIAPMYKKKRKKTAQSAVGIVKSLPFKGNEINSLFNAPQDLLKHALLIIDA